MNEFCRLRRNERYGACPDEVYKCALCSKGIYSAFPLSARFFRYFRAGSLVSASLRSAAASSSVMVLASGTMLSKTAPRRISRWLRVRRSSWGSFFQDIFCRFSSCRIFFFPSSISACSSSRVFSLGFVIVGRSFLPIGTEKGQSISRLSLVVYSLLVSITCQRILLLRR